MKSHLPPKPTITDILEHADEYNFVSETYGFCSICISEETSRVSVKTPEGIFTPYFFVPPHKTLRVYLVDLGAQRITDKIAHDPKHKAFHPIVSPLYTQGAVLEKLRAMRAHSLTEEKYELLSSLVSNDTPLWMYEKGEVYMHSDYPELLAFFESLSNPTRDLLRFERPPAYHNLRQFMDMFVQTICREIAPHL